MHMLLAKREWGNGGEWAGLEGPLCAEQMVAVHILGGKCACVGRGSMS